MDNQFENQTPETEAGNAPEQPKTYSDPNEGAVYTEVKPEEQAQEQSISYTYGEPGKTPEKENGQGAAEQAADSQNQAYSQNQSYSQNQTYGQNPNYSQNQTYGQNPNYSQNQTGGQYGGNPYSGYNNQSYQTPQMDSTPLSMGEWLLTVLAGMIPCAGIVLYCIWAFSKSGNLNRRNFCRAYLILQAITIVIGLIFVIFIAIAAGISAGSYYY